MTSSVKALIRHTADFFNLHWNSSQIADEAPLWSAPWLLEGAAPNFNRQGVYAFVKGAEVTYIGSGTGKGKKGYEGHGLGARLGSYIRVAEVGRYYAIDPRLEEADHVLTIGFPQGYGHIAVALEYYLLARMPTRFNQNRPGS